MVTVCKTWRRDTDEFNGLCSQELQPKTGTNECPVCIEPVDLLPPTGCGACLSTEVWPNTYRLATPFTVSGASAEGQYSGTGTPYTITVSGSINCVGQTTATYNSIYVEPFYYFSYAGFSWDDFTALSAGPLIRTERSSTDVTGPCLPECSWISSRSKLLFSKVTPAYPWVKGCKGGIYGDNGYRADINEWITTAAFGMRKASFNNGCSNLHRVNFGDLTSPNWSPDISYKWPQNFGSLSGSTVNTTTPSLYQYVPCESLPAPYDFITRTATCSEVMALLWIHVEKSGDNHRFNVGIQTLSSVMARKISKYTYRMDGADVHWTWVNESYNVSSDPTGFIPSASLALSPLTVVNPSNPKSIYWDSAAVGGKYAYRSAWVPCSVKSNIQCLKNPATTLGAGMPDSVTLIGQ